MIRRRRSPRSAGAVATTRRTSSGGSAISDGRSGGVPGGERRLPREHGEIADEGPLLALGEVAVTLRRVIDDVDGSALDDVERRLALAVPEHFVAPAEGL